MRRTANAWGTVALMALFGVGASRAAQDDSHTAPASGVPHGIPRICAATSVRSVTSGAWSNPSTWSTGQVPAAGDLVLVRPGTEVTYDRVSDAPVACIDVEGLLRFRADISTRLTVGTLTVLEGGRLEMGTAESPVAANVTAELVIADRPIDVTRDPEQLTGGLVGLGTVRMHGAPKEPTFLRLAAEPLAGQSTLTLERAASSWAVGDRLVLPDTRHLRDEKRGARYTPQWEELTIAAISGSAVTLTRTLAFDHTGARLPDGTLEFLPHVGNLTRNVIVRRQIPPAFAAM